MLKTSGKLWSMVLSACLLLTMLCTVPVAAEDTIVYQYGFDADLGDWNVPDPKQMGTVVDVPETKVVVDSAATQQGEGYLSLTTGMSQTGVDEESNPTYTKYSAQATISDIVVEPEQMYTLSFYFKSPGDSYLQATVYVYSPGAEKDEATAGYIVNHPAADGWTKSTIAFTTSTAAKDVSVYFTARSYYHDMYDSNTICIDTVSLTKESDGAMVIGANETGYVAFQQGGYSFAHDSDTTPVVVSGNLTAESSTVSLGLQLDGSLSASAMTSKTVNGSTDFQILGEYPKKLNLKAPALKITAGEAAVTVKNVTVAKDENLVPNGNFEATSTSWGGSTSSGFEFLSDAPYTGNYYLKVTANASKERTTYSTLTDVIKPYGTNRYLFSVYYKSNADNVALIRIINEDKTINKEFTPSVTLAASNEWKKVEITFERRELTTNDSNDRFYIYLGTSGTTETGAYACFDAATIVPLTEENEKLAFYDTTVGTLEIHDSGEENVNRVQTKPEYGNFLGTPVSTIDSTITSLSAVYVDSALSSASKTSANAVILAVYRTVGDTKQLVDVSVSPTPAADTAEVVYPTAMLSTSGLTAGDEIRAFLWDGISGLKPLAKAIKTIK